MRCWSPATSRAVPITIGDAANLTTTAVLGGDPTGSTTSVSKVGSVILGAATGNTGAKLSPSNSTNGSGGNGGFGATLNIAGNLTITAGSGAHLEMAVGRVSAGADSSLNSDYSDRLTVSGTISLAGDLDISLLTATNYSLAQGDELYLIINNGSSAISGTFDTINGVGSGIAQDTVFSVNGVQFQLSYTASTSGGAFDGGGNSVALLVVPEPGSAGLVWSGVCGLLLFGRSFRQGGRACARA
ncbi:MAG: hypothetical protein QM796_08705 [Chthoniobacteraceae bacterium]